MPLSIIQEREVALAALVDVRTLRRALAGQRVRAMARYRIERALSERGLAGLLPGEERQ